MLYCLGADLLSSSGLKADPRLLSALTCFCTWLSFYSWIFRRHQRSVFFKSILWFDWSRLLLACSRLLANRQHRYSRKIRRWTVKASCRGQNKPLSDLPFSQSGLGHCAFDIIEVLMWNELYWNFSTLVMVQLTFAGRAPFDWMSCPPYKRKTKNKIPNPGQKTDTCFQPIFCSRNQIVWDRSSFRPAKSIWKNRQQRMARGSSRCYSYLGVICHFGFNVFEVVLNVFELRVSTSYELFQFDYGESEDGIVGLFLCIRRLLSPPVGFELATSATDYTKVIDLTKIARCLNKYTCLLFCVRCRYFCYFLSIRHWARLRVWCTSMSLPEHALDVFPSLYRVCTSFPC